MSLTAGKAPAAFINLPYDDAFEKLFLAFIAGLSAFGLTRRATLEIPGSERRLDRIIELIRECEFSFHDLSRIELDRRPPATPRFNMPFELGLAIGLRRTTDQCFVFEAKAHRLTKSLSDLNGTDPYIHNGKPEGVLRELSNALVRRDTTPTMQQLNLIYGDLLDAALRLKKDSGGPLFAARPFRVLVLRARRSAANRLGITSRG